MTIRPTIANACAAEGVHLRKAARLPQEDCGTYNQELMYAVGHLLRYHVLLAAIFCILQAVCHNRLWTLQDRSSFLIRAGFSLHGAPSFHSSRLPPSHLGLGCVLSPREEELRDPALLVYYLACNYLPNVARNLRELTVARCLGKHA